MANTEDGAPITAAKTDEEKKTPEAVVKPLRTMRGDLAELLSKNTLSPLELKSIRTQLQDEARAYLAQGGDENYLANMLPGKKKDSMDGLYSAVGKSTPKPDEADLFVQKTTAEIIAEQIPKARQKTEELKQAITPPAPVAPVIQAKPVTPPVLAHVAMPPVLKKEAVIPPIKKPEVKLPPIDPLEEEEKELAKAFATLPEKERVLADATQKLVTERAGFENLLGPLREEEQILEEKENSLHIEEARAENNAARRQIEEERWHIEDRRRAVEQKRWKVDQEIIRIQNDTNRLESEKKNLLGVRQSLDERKKLLEKKKRARSAQGDFKRLEGELASFTKEKEPLELSWIELNEKRKATLNEIDKARDRARALEDEITEAEVAERKTQTPEERHTFEARRWKAEEERRMLLKKHWSFEDSLGALEESMKVLKEKYQKILAHENDVKKGMEELQSLINEVHRLS